MSKRAAILCLIAVNCAVFLTQLLFCFLFKGGKQSHLICDFGQELQCGIWGLGGGREGTGEEKNICQLYHLQPKNKDFSLVLTHFLNVPSWYRWISYCLIFLQWSKVLSNSCQMCRHIVISYRSLSPSPHFCFSMPCLLCIFPRVICFRKTEQTLFHWERNQCFIPYPQKLTWTSGSSLCDIFVVHF